MGECAADVTPMTITRNVPGVALYFTSLNHVRTVLATTPYFAVVPLEQTRASSGSVLPKLSKWGNLLAGATARVAVGTLLNPFAVLKARYEVRLLHAFTYETANITYRAISTNIKASLARYTPLCKRVPRNYFEEFWQPRYAMRLTQGCLLCLTSISRAS